MTKEDTDMRIAIASMSTEPDAEVSQHGARTAFYLIYNGNGDFQEAIANPYANAERGAGPKAARFLAQQDVQCLVAANFGERFVTELEAGGIRQIQKTGIVSDVITEVLVFV